MGHEVSMGMAVVQGKPQGIVECFLFQEKSTSMKVHHASDLSTRP